MHRLTGCHPWINDRPVPITGWTPRSLNPDAAISFSLGEAGSVRHDPFRIPEPAAPSPGDGGTAAIPADWNRAAVAPASEAVPGKIPSHSEANRDGD
jgi:hypothetical protein